jgi:hypothetical protein
LTLASSDPAQNRCHVPDRALLMDVVAVALALATFALMLLLIEALDRV